MWSETGAITFSTPASFADVLHSVRLALNGRGVRVLAESDVASRLKQALGVRLPPCRVLYVWPKEPLAQGIYPAAAVLLPLHVVVAGRGHRTDICVFSRPEPEGRAVEGDLRSTVQDTLAAVLLSIETISMRPGLVQTSGD